jgi:ABC-type polysaccharide/polyol phosphate transport system ATPase subunit
MLVDALRLRTRSKRSSLLALEDIDLEIAAGESIGVLGRNGAGKSTLLQLLCGVTAPTTGMVKVRGRVAPLISVGVGFHPELTGRENVHVNATILGMNAVEIEKRFDSIVSFAEVENFIDTPVKFYSSGMFVRLGFAVAVAAEPDVLLVDEVLAVGDFAFQLKCFERMREIRANGTTIVVVSHNTNVVRGFCDRSIVLSHGQIVFDGATFEAISTLYEIVGAESATDGFGLGDLVAHGADIDDFTVTGVGSDQPSSHFNNGDEVVLRVKATATTDIQQPVLGVALMTGTGAVAYSDTNLDQPFAPLSAGESASYEMRVRLTLPTGSYLAAASIHSADSGVSVQLGRAMPVPFFVSGRGHVHGAADLGGTFSPSPDH